MRDSTRNYLRDELYYYKENKKIIATFRESVLYPHKEIDENIGGGRSSFISDPTGTAAIKAASAKELTRTMESISIIERLLSRCTNEHSDVVHAKYIDGHKGKNNDMVAHEIHLSPTTVKRKDKEFLEMFRLELGMP